MIRTLGQQRVIREMAWLISTFPAHSDRHPEECIPIAEAIYDNFILAPANRPDVDTDPQDVAGRVHEHEYDGSGYYCKHCGRYDEQREKLEDREIGRPDAMSPHEQARNLIHDWIDAVGDPRLLVVESESEPAWAELENMIAAALAASAAKADSERLRGHQESDAEWVEEYAKVRDERDNLRERAEAAEVSDAIHAESLEHCEAKLEASEREVESWKIMADNMRVRSEASERARKQVTEYAMRTVTLTGWDDDGATTPIDPRLSWESVARLALDYAMAALASPEARATGEDRA